MLFPTPALTTADERAIARIDELRQRLRFATAEPRRWSGLLRRTAFARAIQGSNSIEGYVVTLDDALAAVEGEKPLDAASETWAAVLSYRNAMTYVLQLVTDPHVEINEAFIRSLHFMMTGYNLAKNPGRWRPGAIYVRNDANGDIVYEGPDFDEVPQLMREFVTELQRNDHTVPVMFRAAMAHLNLAMIHPFSDGNGRMARCLQTLVLAREEILVPQFSSIEEYLGLNTQPYYAVLAEVGQGRWQPHRDARPWIRFILTAHFHQAQTLLRRLKESETLWRLVEEVVGMRRLPERSIPALFDAASGRRLRRESYRALVEEGLSEAVATRDLRVLVSAGFLTPHGEKRGRYYLATTALQALQEQSRRPQTTENSDPYADSA